MNNEKKIITLDNLEYFYEKLEVTVPTKTSDLENDSGFITINDVPTFEVPDEYVTDEELSQKGYATEEWVNNKNYATESDLNNIEYSSIKNAPISEDENGELNITDKNGNIGMKVSSEAVYAKDFISGEHKLSEKANKTYVDNSIAELVDGAPETLDTLNELSAALKDNADIIDVLNQSISSKQDKVVSVGGTAKVNWNTDVANAPRIHQQYVDGIAQGPIVFDDDLGINSFRFETSSGIEDGEIIFDEYGIHYLLGFPLFPDGKIDVIHTGDGTKFLSDDGTYKTISGGSIGGEDILDALNQSISSKQDKVDNLVIAEDVNEELDDVETNTYLKYIAQTLTEEQKSQARSNIGVNLTDYAKKSDLSNVATSGSYNDLTNKPTILSESDVNNLIDTKIGDINSILESIIGPALTFPITLIIGDNGVVGINLFNYLYNKYSAKDTISEDIYVDLYRIIIIDYKAEDYVVLIGESGVGYILYSSGVMAIAGGSGGVD